MSNVNDFLTKENNSLKNTNYWDRSRPDWVNPLAIIRSAAEGMGIQLNCPKKDCKFCHGRGWVGIRSETGEPIACKCLFPKENFDREVGDLGAYHRPLNRAERRKRK